MNNRIFSYTAANALPIKIFKNIEVVYGLNRGQIRPYHVQLIPTNRCNLNCSFCSCKNRSKSDELSIEQITALLQELYAFGCRAITITGGGEPLLHPRINDIIEMCGALGIKIGLVTNGVALTNLHRKAAHRLTWCRISCSDELKLSAARQLIISDAVDHSPAVDWAFSYVVGEKFDPDNLAEYIAFANKKKFSHVRVVSDLIDLDNCPEMEQIKAKVKELVDDSLVIYQGRKNYQAGHKDCYISLLKPVIGADGYIYPCCGAQYAHQEQTLDLSHDMRMGHIKDIRSIYFDQKVFNGSKCFRCYYRLYNDMLGNMIDKTKHVEFV